MNQHGGRLSHNAVEQPAGSHSLASATHRGRWADERWVSTQVTDGRHRCVCGAFALLGFLARAGYAESHRPGFDHVEACVGAQLRQGKMIAAAFIQPASGDRDEASARRHGFAMMKRC